MQAIPTRHGRRRFIGSSEAPIINRVFYDDYMAIFEEDRFQIDRMEIMYNELPRDHLDRLKRAFPGRRNFTDYGGKYKLVNRSSPAPGQRRATTAPRRPGVRRRSLLHSACIAGLMARGLSPPEANFRRRIALGMVRRNSESGGEST